MTLLPNYVNRLVPGEVSDAMFYILIDISPIRSEKVVNALRAFFVESKTRSEACHKYNVNPGYLSVKVRELQELNNKLLSYYPHFNQFMVMKKIM